MCLEVSWCVLGCPRVLRLTEKDDPLLEKKTTIIIIISSSSSSSSSGSIFTCIYLTCIYL